MFLISLMHNGYPGVKKKVEKFSANCIYIGTVVYF